MFRWIRQSWRLYRDIRKKTISKNEQEHFQIFLNEKPLNVEAVKINGFLEKVNNLIFKSDLSSELGYRYVNRRGISTLGLRYPVDIILCDVRQTIIDIYEDMPPQKMTHYYENVRYIYIFSKDFIQRYDIAIGDVFVGKKIKYYHWT